MGKCLGCNKKLGLFSGYAIEKTEFCKECYPKRKKLLDKQRRKEEGKEKKKREKYKKENLREKDAKKILKLNSLNLRNELLHKRAKSLNREKAEKLIRQIDRYRNFKTFSRIIYVFGIIIWVTFGKAGIIGLPLLMFILIAWFINSSRKNSLIDELKNLKII